MLVHLCWYFFIWKVELKWAEIYSFSFPTSNILNDAIRAEVTARLCFIYFTRCGQNVKLLIFRLMRVCRSAVSSISRAEQTLAQSEWESPHLQSECTRVFILTWFMITNPTNTPTSSPPEIDERIMKLRRQQLDKKQTQESSLVKLKLNGVIKTFQQEETLLQRWATTELLINRQPCIL